MNETDGEIDQFDESQCELVKYVILQKEKLDGDIQFTSIELHTTVGIPLVLQGQSITRSKASPYRYRVYTHQGTVSDTKDENSGIKKSYLAKTGPEALKIFQEQHDIWTSKSHNMTKTKVMLSRWLGSNVLTKRLLESQASKGEVSSEVAHLADNLWKESMGELSQVLTVPVKSIPIGKVEKAESVLLQIKRALLDKESKDESVIHGLSEQFHELIPHKAECRNDLTNMKMVAIKQDLCQLIQDVINVNEALGWKKQPSSKSKYRAMRCYIESLDTDHPEYKKVEELVMSSSQPIDHMVSIQRIFAINRALDEFKFNRTIGNERLLFHASKACNFLGILSRGILLPKIVVEMFGIDRWDAGMLGSGIYFGDCMSTCSKYSTPGKFTGTRFLAINNVALGKMKDIYEKRTDIECAPEGFESVHGVRKTEQNESFFVDDEYVVYQANRHCLRYLVEFKLIERNSDDTDNQSASASQVSISDDSSGDDTDSDDNNDDEIDILDVQGMVYPEAKVKAGLNTTGEGQVELEAVHVRASIIDLAAEVIVLQKYRNIGEQTAETRYVFPLDERAAVCGFDAYINGKHVIGIVEEKEQARKSYDKAKEQGHGAYLMEEEAANVFAITVGNLPPGSCVVISVRYVTELVVEGDRIAFNLLGSVAPWKKKEILMGSVDEKGDAVDGVVENKQNRSESFMAKVEMPSRIRSIHCPTHSIKVQKKDEKLLEIAMCDGDKLVDGLQLLVEMDNAHKPRIWRETLPDDHSRQACMVVFYPEFPVTTIENPEVVIMLDRSTSMKGQPMNDAKKLVHMVLESLPPQSRYNLVVFGNDFDELYPTSVLATDENIKHTESFLMTVTWERGATEVWRPLRAMSLLSSSDVRLTSNGFLISDGHVTNEQDTLLEVASNRQINRLFTFGVSSESNRHVLRTLADTGGGAYEQFDPRSKSTWEAKVQSQVRRSCQPAATSIKVNWISTKGDAPIHLTRKEIVQAPSQNASLFTGTRLVLYAMGPEVSKVELEAEIEGRTECFEVSADETSSAKGLTLHRLATRGIVRDWELGSVHANRLENDAMMDDVRRHLVKLGVEFNIVSPLTSFIAIEKRDEEDENMDTDGPSLTTILEGLWPTSYNTSSPWIIQDASTGIETSCSMTQVNETLTRASSAQSSFSFVTAEHQYKQAWKLATDSFEPLHPAVQKACLALAQFHLRVKGEVQEAHKVLFDCMHESDGLPNTDLDRKLTNMAKICKNLLNKEDLKTWKDQKQAVEMGTSISTCDELESESLVLEEEIIVPEEETVVMSSPPIDQGLEVIAVEEVESMPLFLEEETYYEAPCDVYETVEEIKVYHPVLLEAAPEQAAQELPIMHEIKSVSKESYIAEHVEIIECIEPSEKMELRAESPVMLEARREPSPVMLQRAESPVLMMRESAKLSYAVAEHDERVQLQRIEPVEMELRAESPVMLEARRAPSPVMLEARREPSPVMLEVRRAPSPVMLEARRAPSPVMMEARRAPSPVMLEARRELSPVMLQRDESPVLMMREVQSVQLSYATAVAEPVETVQLELELRAKSPVMLDEIRAPSPVMLQRAESPVLMMRDAQSAQLSYEMAKPVKKVQLEPIESEELELRAESPMILDAVRPVSPLLLEARRAPSPVMLEAVQEVKMSLASAVAEPIERLHVESRDEELEEFEVRASLLDQIFETVRSTKLHDDVQDHVEKLRRMPDACAPYKSYLATSPKDKKDESVKDEKKVDGVVNDQDKPGIETMRRLLKMSQEDNDGWWTWNLNDLETEFGVDCRAITAALHNPKDSFCLVDSLVDKWMSSMDEIKTIVASALVLSIFDTWVSRIEFMVSILMKDDPEILFIPAQIQEWFKHCLPIDVIQLHTMAFGESSTWSSILERFPPDVIEDVIRPIRNCMINTR
nr:protein mono-ADP-ribosyltransferase PARP4-like [Lytechinus pictus]